MKSLDQILFPVVLCTQDEARRKNALRLIRNLNKNYSKVGMKILVFDNGSVHRDILEEISVPHFIARCSVNVGYWSALKWVVTHYRSLFGQDFEFIHPIESDFYLYKLQRLNDAQEFLKRCPSVNTVRTQEFHVKYRNFYFKQSRIPRFLKRSVVSNYNGVTRETVVLSEADNAGNVYLSNWHAKVPALHRIEIFGQVFDELSELPIVTEEEFMKAMHRYANNVGVLDGGIWSMNLASPKLKGVTGSYSDAKELDCKNYRNTRIDRMETNFPEPDVRFVA